MSDASAQPGDKLSRTVSVEERRELVFHMRFVRNLSYQQIADELCAMEPPIVMSRMGVHRDLEWIRKRWAERLRPEKFDARLWLGERLAEYRVLYELALTRLTGDKKAAAELKPHEAAILIQTASAQIERAVSLMQDVGLVHRKLGELKIDPLRDTREHIPTAPEIRAMIDQANVEIIDADFMSEAEREQRYGASTGTEHQGHDAGDSKDGTAHVEGDRGSGVRAGTKGEAA